MSKKIKDENGNVYVKKKPFYKRVWFWILAIIVIAIVGGSMSGKSKSDSSSSNASSSSSKKETNKINKDNFDKITVSDSTGTSPSDVKEMFGKSPNSTSEQTVENVKAKMYTWSGVANGDITSSIVIGFENDHAISKAISGLKVTRSSKITLSDFDSLENGTSKADVTSKFGDPNGYSYTNIAGQESEIWEYTSGVKGDLGANFSVTFDNGVVSGKTQTSMK
ncbi:DUF3862 domain-containing protein [Ligilactobacillus sp. WILCCON 0076]|uniref:DUF3862 domain-containing protein n=1 Tax=Ligilactobacillus ubinensis TaxID=2876789 RepID=A0A9X2JJZ2_9LACO|nr:DUF3862 domain-containing protein [Ligilactobacillus ubinensis]MCP0885883.1 DUF3862 domain-containing protein [Ligilactobacillus ubinensis]